MAGRRVELFIYFAASFLIQDAGSKAYKRFTVDT